MQHAVHILLITGPAGIGKSTLCWEIGGKLAKAGISHAIIETDELDRVYPKPGSDELERLRPGSRDVSAINLAALWSTYEALGHSRLIMSGVMMHLEFDRRWILQAIPKADISVVRLSGTETTLNERLARREIGAGAEEQLHRSLGQARRMATETGNGLLRVSTDGKRPDELAVEVLRGVGWLS